VRVATDFREVLAAPGLDPILAATGNQDVHGAGRFNDSSSFRWHQHPNRFARGNAVEGGRAA
jgi:hypothetical protein